MGRLAQLEIFLGRVIVTTARGYSVEVNPKYIRDVIAVLGLGDSRLVATPSVKRTPTNESLVELENDKRAVFRTVVGKLLYLHQERADITYSVKAARKIEMNMRRIALFLNGLPSANCLIEIVTFPQYVNVYTDSDWAGRPMTCKSTSGRVVHWRNATLSAGSRPQHSLSLSSAEAELCALTTGISDGVVTKHLWTELGHEVTLVNHVDSQSAKEWASKPKLGRTKHVMLKFMFVQDVVKKKQTNLAILTKRT